jgi:hypothetical protein
MGMAASFWMVMGSRVTTERRNDQRAERVFVSPSRACRVVAPAPRLSRSAPSGPPSAGPDGPLLTAAASGAFWQRSPGGGAWSADRRGCGGPGLGGASGGAGLLPGCSAGAGEGVECLLDAFDGVVALQQVTDLGAGEPVGRPGERGVDLLGERVAAAVVDRPGGGAVGVVPERERGGQMLRADRVGGVEQRVEERPGWRVLRRGR